MASAASHLGQSVDELLGQAYVAHGCTVGTNALVEGRTARVGLLVTAGHTEPVFAMKAGGRLRGLPPEYIAALAKHDKPAALVPRRLIREVHERVTSDGKSLVEMEEGQVRQVVGELLAEGAEAFAVSLLWSTVNPDHEIAVKGIVEEMAPGAFVSRASEVVPRVGEYERTIGSVVNSLIGPVMRDYLRALRGLLADVGYRRELGIMSCWGGLIDSSTAERAPLLTIGSGPAAGVVAAQILASARATVADRDEADAATDVGQPAAVNGADLDEDIVTGDMGGTSFDVGLVVGGTPVMRTTSRYGQYEYAVPTFDVQSIGSGGGSIVRFDASMGTLRVGPQSAGARPGPAAFLRGGTEATVTDADVVLGYLNPEYFLEGSMSLGLEASRAALERAGAPLGFGAEETAAATARIVDSQMADAIRLISINKGRDPRQLTLYAYGGNGPMHAPTLARGLGVKRVVVPLGDLASGWSAFGVAASEAVVFEEAGTPMLHPFDPEVLEAIWQRLENQAIEKLALQGIGPPDVRMQRLAEMKYASQVNQVRVEVPFEHCDHESTQLLVKTFEAEYEQFYGSGSGYPDAGFAVTALAVRASARRTSVAFGGRAASRLTSPHQKSERGVIWYKLGPARVPTAVYDGTRLTSGYGLRGTGDRRIPGHDPGGAARSAWPCRLDGQRQRRHGGQRMTAAHTFWDGKVHAYRPGADWRDRVSPTVDFHVEENPDLDPVTYEVIRHRLWTTNIGHGEMVTRVSGSPIFQLGDFNMCILTEDGEVVMNAPYVAFLDSGAPLAIAYILENLSDDPGVADGDVFACNDPWVGAVHQMDVFLGMPVFVEGKLFAWVSNAGHQYDLGGVAPGGWPENAVDVYQDPVVMPPFKLVEKGHLRKDLEALYLRHSRFPDLVVLDLRAQLAGCRFAAEQLKAAVAEFGAPTVKAAMRRVLNTAQASFQDKLRRIPDGRWSEVFYFHEKLPGDRHLQRVQLNVEKVGDRLKVDNHGTQAQEEGPNGITYVGFSGAVLGALTLVMLQDQLFAMGGAARQVDIEPESGLLTCVDHPAAVSGGVINVPTVLHHMMALLGRMLACDPAQAGDAVAPQLEGGLNVIVGADDRGRGFGMAFIEQATGHGATADHDGVDTAGLDYTPLFVYNNVEEQESFYPVLILYRRQLTDSPGAGRWRGGGGIQFGAMEYRSAVLQLNTNVGGAAICGYGAKGVMGAYPVSTLSYTLMKDTNVYELFKQHQVPTDVGDLVASEVRRLHGKSTAVAIDYADVVANRFPGGGGYGDPLLREPERVGRDVAEGWVSVQAAREIYGVVTDAAGTVDDPATELQRAAILTERASWPKADDAGSPRADVTPKAATGELPRPVHAVIEAADDGPERVLRCSRCLAVLAPYRGNVKSGLLVNASSVTVLPLVDDPSYFTDDPLELRRYCCPGCQVLVLAEVVGSHEPHLADMSLY